MNKQPKKKEGIARLMELAGTKKSGLTAACTLSVLSSVCKIIPYFTIYEILKNLIQSYSASGSFSFSEVKMLVLLTAVSAVLYGIFAYASAMLSHGAAFDILYELRMKLMEKMGRISSGYYTSNTQGSIKKLLIEDVEQIEIFIAHSMCEVAAAIATPLFTIIVLFIVDWRLTLVSLLPIICSFVILGMALKKPDGAKHQQNMADAKAKMEGTIIEYIHGMSVIKIFGGTKNAFRRTRYGVLQRQRNGAVLRIFRRTGAVSAACGDHYAESCRKLYRGAAEDTVFPCDLCRTERTAGEYDERFH